MAFSAGGDGGRRPPELPLNAHAEQSRFVKYTPLNYGEAFARSAAKRDGEIFKTHTWATRREEATAAATTLGLQVT